MATDGFRFDLREALGALAPQMLRVIAVLGIAPTPALLWLGGAYVAPAHGRVACRRGRRRITAACDRLSTRLSRSLRGVS